MEGILWRLWKWILHCITGHCEAYRLCLSNTTIPNKTTALVRCLKASRVKVLRDVVKQIGVDTTSEDAADIIIREKSIKPHLQMKFREHIAPCFSRVSGVRKLFVCVEKMRGEMYDEYNEIHEGILMKLWSNLMPDANLTARVSKEWQEVGFQGNNPATDFRGMGMLGLQCLVYFSEQHQNKARTIFLHSRHPQYWYPYAVVGIDLTGVIYSWLKEGELDSYLFSTCSQPPSITNFMEIFCFIFANFDLFWASKKPENIMSFPKVKAEFIEQLKREIDKGDIKMCL